MRDFVLATALGGSLLYLLLFLVALLAFAFLWIVLLVRAAINKELSTGKKIFWVLGILLFPPLSLFYALRDRSKFWRVYATINILLLFPIAGMAIFAPDKAGQRTESAPAMSALVVDKSLSENALLVELQDKVTALHEAHKDGLEGLPYAGVDLKLTLWEMKLSQGELRTEQIAPHLSALQDIMADGLISEDEFVSWSEACKAAGL